MHGNKGYHLSHEQVNNSKQYRCILSPGIALPTEVSEISSNLPLKFCGKYVTPAGSTSKPLNMDKSILFV